MKTTSREKCPSIEQLSGCLDPVAEAASLVTKHLESCNTCRDTLSFLAGGPQWWSEAESFLSRSSDASESRVGQRVCALAGQPTTGHSDRLTDQESLQLKQLIAPPSHPELLGRINRYELEQLVGRGGMGLVFRAYDTELNRPVAVKVLALHLIGIGSARERFIREARAVASLSHPHIVPVYDVVTDGELPAIVMQFIAGETLQNRIARRGPLPVEDVLEIGIQLADALTLAHHHGLVHRDIKPGNVLLEADGSRALLSDFGLVRALDDATLTHSGLLAGTPDYMSPEQARGQAVDARSDLFSLGSLLYTMLVGHPPFRAPEPMAVLNRICHERHRPAHVAETRTPIEVSQLIDRMLTKDVKHRIATAELVRDRLLKLSRSPRRLAFESTPMHRSLRWTPLAIGLLLLALVIRFAAPFVPNRIAQPSARWPVALAGDPVNSAYDEQHYAPEDNMSMDVNTNPDMNMEMNLGIRSGNSFEELQQIDQMLSQFSAALNELQQVSESAAIVDPVEPSTQIDQELQVLRGELNRIEEQLQVDQAGQGKSSRTSNR